jgi:hypothetical protein
MEPISLGGLLSSTKTAIDLIVGAVKARDEAKANEIANSLSDKFTKIYAALIDAQQKTLAAQEEIRLLKDQIESLRMTNDESARKAKELERYDLVTLPEGPTVYRLKETEAPQHQLHYRCPACVTAGKTGYLQPQSKGMRKYLICPDCRFEYPAGYVKTSHNHGVARRLP